jgi:hypothetical protein
MAEQPTQAMPAASPLSPRGRHWQGLIEQWRHSGLTQTAFCGENQLNDQTFSWWIRRLQRLAAGLPDTPQRRRRAKPTFVPVHVQPDPPAQQPSCIEIVLAGGRRIRLSGPVDRRQLTEVLAALEGPAC